MEMKKKKRVKKTKEEQEERKKKVRNRIENTYKRERRKSDFVY